MMEFFILTIMKNGMVVFLLALISLLSWGCSVRPSELEPSAASSGEAPDTVSSIQMISPRGDDQWEKGESYRIRWSGGPEQVSLFFKDTALAEQGASVSITERITNIKNEGVYEYTVPSDLNPGWYRWCLLASNEPNEICGETFEVVAAPTES
ncbi:MAG: hypothetical protein ACD_28C00179G0006 [uncultured bacterium]|nr:MAG: hypothetical protein ACD_28C00179G0006 [uncultured bacterium]KKT72677.1 MAG: hypothetical protein UW70_C0103G0004 [Candidatus Peregrinibacteria bacterium GW2011_GWA2_44_7]